MKTILGLDLGTTSVGWALVKEAETEAEQSQIVKIGVRLVPLSTDEKNNFEKGKSITTNADRTLKRSLRRNLQRYKLRRDTLIQEFRTLGWIDESFDLSEQGPSSTFATLKLRAKAAEEEVSLQDLAKVLLQINKKRGYRSSRKLNLEDGVSVDGMDIAKLMYERGITPGELVYERMMDGKFQIPEFYRSDLQAEFDKIWSVQKAFHPELTDNLKENLQGKNKGQTSKICHDAWGVEGIISRFSGQERKLEAYQYRVQALKKEMSLEILSVVF